MKILLVWAMLTVPTSPLLGAAAFQAETPATGQDRNGRLVKGPLHYAALRSRGDGQTAYVSSPDAPVSHRRPTSPRTLRVAQGTADGDGSMTGGIDPSCYDWQGQPDPECVKRIPQSERKSAMDVQDQNTLNEIKIWRKSFYIEINETIKMIKKYNKNAAKAAKNELHVILVQLDQSIKEYDVKKSLDVKIKLLDFHVMILDKMLK